MRRSEGLFPLGTDSVLLADFVSLPPHAAVFDLGAGAGTLGLLLCAGNPDCRVTGLELQEAAVAQAAADIAARGLSERLAVLPGDLRRVSEYAPAGKSDAVVCNPPYFPVGSGAVAAIPGLALSRTELGCTFADVSAAAAYLLRWGGRFFLVHRPERLCDLLTELRRQRLEPKRLRLVRCRPASPPALVLLESRLGGKPGLNIEPDLLLQDENGRESAEYQRIYGLGGTV
ncbi:MAG: methyltransferase [Oscillospiraceae bacterium]|nr:methyltransferase [Oscillospiraceae bacterium]